MNITEAMIKLCDYIPVRRKAWSQENHIKIYKRFGDDGMVWYNMPKIQTSILYTPTKKDLLADDWEEY